MQEPRDIISQTPAQPLRRTMGVIPPAGRRAMAIEVVAEYHPEKSLRGRQDLDGILLGIVLGNNQK